MSQNNDSANYTSDSAQKEHKDEGNPRFERGRRGNQEENGQNQDQSGDRKNDDSKGQNKDSNKSDSGPEKNHQKNQENSETPPKNPAQSEDQNHGQTPQPDEKGGPNNEPEESKNNKPEESKNNEPDESKNNEPEEKGRGDKDDEFDGRGRDAQSDDGRGRDDRSWRDDRSDGRSERGDFDELEEECERPEPEEGEEECEPHNPELDEQGNPIHPGGPHHDFSDDGRDHGPGPNHHLPPPNEAPSYRPGFMERTSAYTLTFSSETMFEVLLGSLLILVSAVFLFIYMIKRQRRKTMRSQSPAQNLQFVTPNQNIATSNFYQYYQKEGMIPTGTVVGYIPEGQFLQPGAKNVENLKGFGRLQTQDEILDLS